ncbi:hypothetical protein VU10_05720, partial [Desulfobulbus sp. US1]|nr:hypothetical protein [Desulfobulbus sp. US1]
LIHMLGQVRREAVIRAKGLNKLVATGEKMEPMSNRINGQNAVLCQAGKENDVSCRYQPLHKRGQDSFH